MLPLEMIKIRHYLTIENHSPFEKWFSELDSTAAAKVTKAIYKLELGNFSNVKGAGEGIYEQKIDFGPGYRVYFGKDGEEIIILLCGGTKKRQNKDIKEAKIFWHDYKKRKHKVQYGIN